MTNFKIINGRWFFGNAINTPMVIDIFFNNHRKPQQQPKRSGITKDGNYKFKEVWKS